VAIGAAIVGMAALLGGMFAFLLLGSLLYFLASPFLLFYAYVLLGSDLRSLGEGLRARQHLRSQLDIATTNPRDADAQYQLGLIYQQRHQYDEAKRRFTRAVEIDPREADPIFQLGRIALDEGRLTDAIELLNDAAALDDKCCSHEVWRDLGAAYFRSGRFEEARMALEKFVERRSYDPEGLYWYGKSLLALRRLNEAWQQFEQCREAVDTMPANRRRQLSKWKRLSVAELKAKSN
jgi:tetratricopeptide (TPR) repeat protein